MRILKKLPRISLILALLLVLWLVIAFFGAKFDLIDKLFAFGVMTVAMGGVAAMVVAVLALIALITALFGKTKEGWKASLVALLIPVAVLAGFGQLRARAGAVPFIYDVTTNTAEAPVFSAELMERRAKDGANEPLDFNRPLGEYEKWSDNLELAGKSGADVIAEGYPELESLELEVPVEIAAEIAQAAMKSRNYSNIVLTIALRSDASSETNLSSEGGESSVLHMSRNRGAWVEGTEEIFWYGFRDDVALTIEPLGANGVREDAGKDGGVTGEKAGNGEGDTAGDTAGAGAGAGEGAGAGAGRGRSLVHFRSTSRLGTSDLGVNAQRIMDLRRAIAERAAALAAQNDS